MAVSTGAEKQTVAERKERRKRKIQEKEKQLRRFSAASTVWESFYHRMEKISMLISLLKNPNMFIVRIKLMIY